MLSPSDNNQADVIEALNLTAVYLLVVIYLKWILLIS